ncbi:IclR family transcriptional regulator [Celeribacter indicus]|uniref:Putative transcriptional regulator n=1 Tax=Celeribacter indicus TaxID=1208324 RepID=A0A0B5DUW3_9RHOB|nr:helix-turn-helix domain-containing protein [Celeribacter indicus]AJE46814.1 putative transcriptional regulator [Celeribacter indicus]SDW81273.1 transcriptional regulator, IclR family [Celeribacter indicus]
MTRNSVKSAERVFQILEHFARTREPARLSEVAASLDHPVSSVSALLKCMVDQGYMNFDDRTRRYMPAARIAHLGSWLNFDAYEQTAVLEAMYRLREAANESVVLATPTDIYLEYIDTLHGWEGINIRRGTRRLLVQSGTGWLFLARMDLAQALAIYRRTIELGELRQDEFSETEFLKKLIEHRDMDISFVHARELLRPTAHWGAAMISMIIPTPPGHRGLAMGVHGLAERLETKRARVSDLFHEIAAELEADLAQTAGSAPAATAP